MDKKAGFPMANRFRSLPLLILTSMLLGACNFPGGISPSISEGESDVVPCDISALISILENAPSDHSLEVSLTPDCTYAFTLPHDVNPTQGATGLPLITTEVIIHGNHATFFKGDSDLSPSYGFRYFHVDGGALSIDSLNLVNGGWTGVFESCADDEGGCGSGGAILVEGGSLSISGCSFTTNSAIKGGSIFTEGVSTLNVSGSTFESNVSNQGGAIYMNANSDLLINSSQFLSNESVKVTAVNASGGAVYNGGNAEINGTTFQGNLAGGGGAIFTTGSTHIDSSLFAGNWASGRAPAIQNYQGILEIENSTFSGNIYASKFGSYRGVILNGGGWMTLNHITVTGTQGDYAGGISSFRGVTVQIDNSIIAEMGAAYPCLFEVSDSEEGSNNLVLYGNCPGTIITGDPLLGPLADNGGPTLTHALPFNSPAIDVINEPCLATDQRGVTRPDGDACDLGAYEYGLLGMGGLPPFLPDMSESAPEIQELSAEPYIPEGDDDGPSERLPTGRIDQAILCYEGPGPIYAVVSSLQPGALVEIVGISENGDYIVIFNPCYPGVPCWAAEGSIELHDELDPHRVIPDPAPPEEEPEDHSSKTACTGTETSLEQCKAAGGVWDQNAFIKCKCP